MSLWGTVCSPQTETVAVECVKVARLMCPVCVECGSAPTELRDLGSGLVALNPSLRPS